MHYVDDLNSGELMKTAIDEMLNSLDPYTNYIPESEAEDYKFMTTGQYGGIGALITKKGDNIVISDPYEGFPAQKSGLKSGDILIEVNNTPVKGKTTPEVSDLLKGSPGSEVKIVYQREGEAKKSEKTIIREEIKIKNVPYYSMLDEEIGYIKLTSFTQNAGKEVTDAFLKLKEKKELKGIILDLRGNGGGLLNEAVNIVNIFVNKGNVVVSTKGKLESSNSIHRTVFEPTDVNIPIVVLVDNNSASASEIVTGSIQDMDRGVVIGQKTFGKGLVQNIIPLSYNAQLKVTVAKYYIPSGRCIQAIDYSHKNKDGKATKVADSLKTAFKTKNGRVVYESEGIEPDIAMKPKEYSNVTVSLITKFHIFDFATKYNREHPTIASADKFAVDENIYNEFIKFISGKDYDYTSRSEKLLKDLKETAEKEKYFDAIKSDYEDMKTKMMHDKDKDLVKFSEEIKQLLAEEIVSRYYYQKGKIEVSLKGDTEIKECIETLKDSGKYKSILAGTYTRK
jgi:carboxyl-terminal processing protease